MQSQVLSHNAGILDPPKRNRAGLRLILRFILPLVLTLPASLFGQFDYGISGGAVLTELRIKESDNPYATSSIGSVGRPTFSASAFYRERYSDFVDLSFDLTLVHHSFDVAYREGGHGGGYSKRAHADLDQLYLGVKPEVRMDAKRIAVVRFGIMAGFLVGGWAKGTSSIWDYTGQGVNNDDALLKSDFGGDFRFAFGFGFRAPVGDRWAVTIDPEATVAFSSMLKKGANMRGSDLGLRIGLSRRSSGKSLTSLIKIRPPGPSKEPIW